MTALADVSRALPGLTVTLTVTRPGLGSYTKGRWSEAAGSTFGIEASIQELRPEEMMRLAEGQRIEATRKLYTKTYLQAADTVAGRRADRFDYKNETWEVLSVADWDDLGGYYKAVVTRAEQ